MFKFQDKSGKLLALRAEMTAPIARFVSATLNAEKMPTRLYYIANVFRYNEPKTGWQREFWQAGAELIGSNSCDADAEIIALMINALEGIGLKNVRVDLGHVGLIKSLMKSAGISSEAAGKIQKLIDKKDQSGLAKALESLKIDADLKEFLSLLPRLRGQFEVIEKASELIDGKLARKPIENLEEILETIEYYGVLDRITLDLSILREIEYYTGVVFEAYVPDIGLELGGGGRYDRLIEEFCGKPIPATGFALIVDRCLIALESQGYRFPTSVAANAILLPARSEFKREATSIAELLRAKGITLEIDVLGRDLPSNLSYASRVGIPYAIIVGEGAKQPSVLLKNLRTGEQKEVTIEELIKFWEGNQWTIS
jgi:ATP phosphoribosyltransferase regulatory subunit